MKVTTRNRWLTVILLAGALLALAVAANGWANCGACGHGAKVGKSVKAGCAGTACGSMKACHKMTATKLEPSPALLKAAASEEAVTAEKKVTEAGLKFASAASLVSMMQSGQAPVFIDVLDTKSYTANRIQGAINIPYDKVDEIAPLVLPDKNAKILVYCGSYRCGASLKAGKALKKLGYTNVLDYKGGLKEWTALGLPMEGSGE